MLRREGDEDRCGEEAHSDVDGMHLCDRTDIFAVGLVGGKSAQVARENAILDLHIERKHAKRTSKGVIGRSRVTDMALFVTP